MQKRKTFIFISTLEHLPWGGCEYLWYKTALHALGAGNKVIAVVFQHQETPAHLSRLAAAGATLLYLERKHSNLTLKKRLLNKVLPDAANKKVMKKLTQLVTGEKPVVLISQAGGFDFAYDYLNPVYDWLLSNNHPYKVVVQNVPDLGFSLSISAAQRQTNVYARAKGVGFVSERNRISSERILATNIRHSFKIDNPVNFNGIPEAAPFPALSEKVSFATVAALRCFHKGQDILLQALASQKWKERDWELNLYGRGDDERYLKQLTAHYDLANRVHFHGHKTDIESIWKENHIHILPSLGEGTPLALIESMLAARPAITSDVGGNAEYCRNMESGFVMTYPTLPAMERILELAWQHKHRWEEFGNNARNIILSNFDLESYITLYKILND